MEVVQASEALWESHFKVLRSQGWDRAGRVPGGSGQPRAVSWALRGGTPSAGCPGRLTPLTLVPALQVLLLPHTWVWDGSQKPARCADLGDGPRAAEGSAGSGVCLSFPAGGSVCVVSAGDKGAETLLDWGRRLAASERAGQGS